MTSKLMGSKHMNGVLVLVLFAVITAFVFNHLSPSGISLVGQWETKKGVVSAKSKDSVVNSSIEMLSSQWMYEVIRSKQRVVIDVRVTDFYQMGHIPSALSFPLADFDQNAPQMLGAIKQADPIVVYCSSVHCMDSHTFARQLTELGYTDVKVFSGGFEQWQEDGYEIETNEE